MPAAVGLKVQGSRKLSVALRKAGVAVQDMRDAHTKVGNIVVRASVPLTPVKSGRLAGSIRTSKEASAATVRAGGGRIPYAEVQHWGWPKHNIRARLFLTNGMANSQTDWMETYFTELQKLMDQIATSADGTGD